ncbi:hypothetical protein [Cereibacter changlensis]|uniref:hypothetical protein n=1 Tax=Cereibacter changlensis TaxID=402884 RepID=UPI0040336903
MTETRTRAGTGMSEARTPVAEVQTAVTGFLKEIKGFRDEVKLVLQQQEERLTMLDRKTMSYGRPASRRG